MNSDSLTLAGQKQTTTKRRPNQPNHVNHQEKKTVRAFISRNFMLQPKLVRFSWMASIAGLIASMASFFVPSYPAGTLCFYFFFAWIIWIGCAWIDVVQRKVIRTLFLWVVLDLSILVCFLSVANSLGDVANSQGAEMVWGIAYPPSILPFGLIVGVRPEGIDLLIQGMTNASVNTLGPAFGHVFSDWAQFSLISIFQCGLIVSIMFFLHKIWRRLMPETWP